MKMKCKKLWAKIKRVFQSISGEINAERYVKELLIDGVMIWLTSLFEGNKDIDKTLERLAVKNALAESEESKSAS